MQISFLNKKVKQTFHWGGTMSGLIWVLKLEDCILFSTDGFGRRLLQRIVRWLVLVDINIDISQPLLLHLRVWLYLETGPFQSWPCKQQGLKLDSSPFWQLSWEEELTVLETAVRPLRTQDENSHQQGQEKDLYENWICWHPDLGLLFSKNPRK